jgi:hypothetical protein
MRLIPSRDICIELQDNSTATKSAVDFFAVTAGRNPESQAARLVDQFITQNKSLFAMLEVSARRDYDGRDVLLQIESKNAVGAVPLISPYNAKHDFGLVVQPRFPWLGIGPMLSAMGWLIVPTPLRLPLLKRSERRVPRWVISCMVLPRLKALLDRLDRRFEMTSELKPAPKGRVDWSAYVNREMPRGRFLSVPCTFPDLRDDRQLKGAIRFTVEKQIQSLETQRQYGAFIHGLIAFAESLLLRVQGVTSRQPGGQELQAWARRPLRADTLAEGLQAIEWTVEERGLAGLSDLEGIPWTMPMESFFEAWVETVLRKVALRTGGRLRVARRRETVSPISWDPPYLGSQNSLVPDLLLEHEDTTLIVDAKYKRHWEEMNEAGWHGTDNEIRERHRHDLLQVLAYANLTSTPRVICCLVYPCSWQTWESLHNRGRLFHCAQLPNRGRLIEVWLTGVPMHAAVEKIAIPFAANLRARQVPRSEDQEDFAMTSMLAKS